MYPHRVEPFAVGETIHHQRFALVSCERREDRREVVNGVVAAPRAGRMRRQTLRCDVEPHGAVAATLDMGRGRLTEDGEVGGQPIGVVRSYSPQPVLGGLDFFVVVEDVGDVHDRLGEGGGKLERYRHTTLHIHRSATPDDLALGGVVGDPGRKVALDRDRVDVARDHNPAGSAEVGTGDHGVAIAKHLKVGVGRKAGLDRIRNRSLISADGRNVTDRAEQHVDRCCREIRQGRGHPSEPTGGA